MSYSSSFGGPACYSLISVVDPVSETSIPITYNGTNLLADGVAVSTGIATNTFSSLTVTGETTTGTLASGDTTITGNLTASGTATITGALSCGSAYLSSTPWISDISLAFEGVSSFYTISTPGIYIISATFITGTQSVGDFSPICMDTWTVFVGNYAVNNLNPTTSSENTVYTYVVPRESSRAYNDEGYAQTQTLISNPVYSYTAYYGANTNNYLLLIPQGNTSVGSIGFWNAGGGSSAVLDNINVYLTRLC